MLHLTRHVEERAEALERRGREVEHGAVEVALLVERLRLREQRVGAIDFCVSVCCAAPGGCGFVAAPGTTAPPIALPVPIDAYGRTRSASSRERPRSTAIAPPRAKKFPTAAPSATLMIVEATLASFAACSFACEITSVM